MESNELKAAAMERAGEMSERRSVDRRASPIAGSVGDDPEFMRKLGAYWQDGTRESLAAMVAYIDARAPRSASVQGEAQLIRAFNSGYKSGHHDTVEGQYTDIDQRDMFTHHTDTIADMIADGTLLATSTPAPAAEPGNELESMTRMFMDACSSLGLISEALDLDPNDGGHEPIIDAIEELKAAAPVPQLAVPQGITAEEISKVAMSLIGELTGNQADADDEEAEAFLNGSARGIGSLHAELLKLLKSRPAAPDAPAAEKADGLKPQHGSLADNLRIEMTDSGRWVVCVENWFPDDDSARAACRKWEAAYCVAPPVKVMVDRFLGWKLPQDFGPDAGISFDCRYAEKCGMPTGTNLLTADQARAMFEYCLAGAAAPVPAQQSKPSEAARDVLAERQRQISAEDWTPEHDDKYEGGELAIAAACYATAGNPPYGHLPNDWPWDGGWWKPTDDRRNLVKAAALTLAEIERIDRAAQGAETPKGGGGK